MVQEFSVKKVSGFLLATLLFAPLLVAAGPDVVLRDFSGKQRNVSEFIGKGKWTVVAFWAHNCPVCNEELPGMTFFHDAHKDKDAVILGVTIDGWDKRKKAQGFIDTHALNFTNLIAEPHQEVLRRFGGGDFYGTPTFYVYSPSGELLARQIGPVSPEDIEKFMNSVNQANGEKTDSNG